MKKCPECGFSNKDQHVFCTQCSTALGNKCTVCGAEADEDEVYCGKCGEQTLFTASGYLAPYER